MSKTAGVGETAVKKRQADAPRSTTKVGIVAVLLAVCFLWFTPRSARAEVDGISLGTGFVVPFGAPYLTYGRYPLFVGNLFVHSESLSPAFRIVGTAEMSVATINNTTVQQLRLWDYAVYGGLRYQTPTTETTGLRPYAQLQLGGVYDVLGLSGASAGVQNSGIEFAIRFQPGFDLWISQKVGVDFGFPLEYLTVRDSLMLWSAIFAVKVKL